jgi:hypothetical protein
MRGEKVKSQMSGEAARKMLWRSIRILRRFTIADLLSVTPGVCYRAVQRFVLQLSKFGHIARQAGKVLGYQRWVLLKDTGPMPSVS